MVEHERWLGRSRATEALAVGSMVAIAYLLLRTAPALAAGAFMDDGVYLSLGKALADGEGYRSLYAAGAPVHLKYPPALPFIYSLLWSFRDDVAFVHSTALLLSLGAAAGTAGMLWWIARAQLQLPPVLTGVFVLGPFLLEGSVQYFNLAVSEPWFMLGWASCLLLAPRANAGWAWAAVVGLLAGVTTLFRTQAVVLLPALAVSLWMATRKPRRSAALLAAGMFPLVAWSLWHRAQVAMGPVSTQPDEATYSSWGPDSVGAGVTLFGQILRSQVARYSAVLPHHVAPWPWLGAAIWLVVVLGFLLGATRHVRDRPASVLSVASLGIVVLLWPFAQDRFVLALLPFSGLVAASGFRSLERTRVTTGRHPGATTLWAGLVLMVAVVSFRQVQIRGLAANEQPGDSTFYFHPAQFLPNNTEFVIAASRWIGAEARPADRLLAPLTSALWLYTGRAGVNATPSEPNVGPSALDEPGRYLASRVIEDDVTLLLLWNPNFLITRDAATVQRACPEALEFLGRTDEPARIAIFRIHREDGCFVDRFLEPARTVTQRTP